MSVVSLFLVVLLATGVLLVWEARTGKLTPSSSRNATLRASLFFAAAVVGGALLMRSASSSLLLAAALAPVTGLSLVRFVAILRPTMSLGRWTGLVSASVILAFLAVGVWASMSLLPQELDQKSFIEQIFQRDIPSDSRSIDPAARRTGRA